MHGCRVFGHMSTPCRMSSDMSTPYQLNNWGRGSSDCLGVKFYYIILHSLWVMCLVSAFCLEFTDLLEELRKNRVGTLAIISYVTTERHL